MAENPDDVIPVLKVFLPNLITGEHLIWSSNKRGNFPSMRHHLGIFQSWGERSVWRQNIQKASLMLLCFGALISTYYGSRFSAWSDCDAHYKAFVSDIDKDGDAFLTKIKARMTVIGAMYSFCDQVADCIEERTNQ